LWWRPMHALNNDWLRPYIGNEEHRCAQHAPIGNLGFCTLMQTVMGERGLYALSPKWILLSSFYTFFLLFLFSRVILLSDHDHEYICFRMSI
jgi:hypothetical protein